MAQERPDSLGLGRTRRGVITRGDAFDLIQLRADEEVDLILTSPPYWGQRSYELGESGGVAAAWEALGCSPSRVPPFDWYRDAGGVLGLEPYPDWYVTHLVEFFNRAHRVLKSSGSVWLNLGDTYFARWASIRDGGRQGLDEPRIRRRTPSGGYLQDKQLLLIPSRVAMGLQDSGWILRNDLIWAKPNVLPRPESDRLRLSHEHWFHFVRRQPRGRAAYYYDLLACEEGKRDVVTYATAKGGNGHSATFPPELIRARIASSCPPNGLVLDPFCGTGRAIAEAVRLGRNAIGFEMSPRYARTAQDQVGNAIREGLSDAI